MKETLSLFTNVLKRPEEVNQDNATWSNKQHFTAEQTRRVRWQEKAASSPAMLALTNSTVQ